MTAERSKAWNETGYFLPTFCKATDSFNRDLKERASVFEKANIVRSTQSHRSPLRRLTASPSDLKPIYGANIQHQPVSKIMKNLRDVHVVPEAARGLSIFGLDSFELLVEESTEEYARGVLKSLKIKTTDKREPLDFMSRSGTKVTNEVQLKSARLERFAAGNGARKDVASQQQKSGIRTRSPNCWRSTPRRQWKRPHANENCVVECKWRCEQRRRN